MPRSFLAALRSLVLPYGQTTGQRILLDGVNGVISVFDSNNVEIARLDAVNGFKSTSPTTGETVKLSAGEMFFNSVSGAAGQYYGYGYSLNNDAAQVFITQVQANGDVVMSIPTGQRLRLTQPVAMNNRVWTTIPLANGWVPRPGFHVPAYIIDATNRVWLRGSAQSGAINSILATLPAEARPANGVQPSFTTDVLGAGSARVTISPAGTLQLIGQGTGAATAGLDGISFTLDT